jgi:glycosyltransferase involved in cell wall biosynthesis
MPHVVPHGIDWHEWQHNEPNEGFSIWSKNRIGDVCQPEVVLDLAKSFPNDKFVTTFLPKEVMVPNNVKCFGGTLPFQEMKKTVQRCGIYLALVKETFCLGALEAMASGKPVLAYNWGNVPNLVPHGVAGYMARVNDLQDLREGYEYCKKHAKVLGDNGREIAKKYTWESAIAQVRRVFDLALQKKNDEKSTDLKGSSHVGLS